MTDRYTYALVLVDFSEVMSASPNTVDPAGDTASLIRDPTESHSFSKDTIFHILQVQRRRLTLQYLQERTDTVTLRDLAEQVAAWENETTVKQLSSTERQRVYISLYQTHLPKLDTEGIIEYNKDRGTIQRTSRADHFDPYLSTTVRQQTSESSATQSSEAYASNHHWVHYYLGGTLLSVSLLGAKVLHLPIVAHLASRLVIPVILLVYTIITVSQHYASSASLEFTSTE